MDALGTSGMGFVLAQAAPPDLFHARMQMALSLGWHIVVACFGVGFPAMVLFGQIYGFPFTLEGFAFFIEAIFVGVYLYGWNRLPPRIHQLSGLPMIAAGIAGAFFVVAANGWMNTPTGFEIRDGQVVNTDPWAAMFNPSTASQSVHMILAAVMVTGFCVASVYAVGMLRGRRDRYHRLGLLLLPLTVGAVAAPIQVVVGDWIATAVAKHQPAKLAALEGLYRSGTGQPLSLGAVSTAPGLRVGFYLVLVVYLVLTVMTVYVLRRLAGAPPETSLAPQEPEEQPVGGPG